MVLKVLTMTDDKTKQKAIEAAADIFGNYYYYFFSFKFDYSFWVLFVTAVLHINFNLF